MDLLWNVYLLIIRCLDVLISSDLLWANPIKDVTSKVRKQIGLLYCHFYKHAELDTLKTLYTALIWPHLEYAVPVWDPHLCKDIDMLESEVCYKNLY